MREAEESIVVNRIRMLRQASHSYSSEPQGEALHMCQSEVAIEPPKRKRVENMLMRRIGGKFKPPFPLYYYRDFMWKVAYSNQFIVETPEEYDGKLKYFVGPGNNSNLIKGLMKRRPWFQLTDKPQDAHFVWSQIKMPFIFQGQKKGEPLAYLEAHTNKGGNNTLCLLNYHENSKWKEYWEKNMDKERVIKETMKLRTRLFGLIEHSLA